MKLQCYCCGEPITGTIALVTPSKFPTDRVFVVNPEHLERIDEESTNSLIATIQEKT